MIIGEAASQLSEEFKTVNQQFNWKVIKGMRNIIVHEYFGIDYSRVWSTIEHDIPKLKSDCLNTIKDL